MKTIKIFITENDAEDIVSNIIRGREGLYANWQYPVKETGEQMNIEIHIGINEDDQEEEE